ncbi:MAG: hypothetical protein IJJ13_01750 [Lachnospiraceae bacterium]|nr:hypothetical protein [Lachnospiraceae bacterium]
MCTTSTPYDDVYRTMLNDCSSLILPVINEMFGEHYTGKEQIVFGINEHFVNFQNGEEEKCVTDTAFTVIGITRKKYHVECQSTPDSTMLIRMFEYESQIALDDGNVKGNTLTVTFPHSGVLYLRHSRRTPDEMTINIRTSGGEVSYPVKVFKTQAYTIGEIFEKRLLFLIPFYIFTHEKRFQVYNNNEKKLESLRNEYEEIKRKLEELMIAGEISEYTKCMIIDMSNRVLEHIAAGYENVREGVENVMGGKVLNYEAKEILNRGISQGVGQGKREVAENLIKRGKLTFEEIAEDTGMTVAEVEALAEKLGVLTSA